MSTIKTRFGAVRQTLDILAKRLDGFVNHTTSLGVQGADPVKDAIIDVARHISDEDLLSLWRDNPYASIGVDDLALTATRKGWRVGTNIAMPSALDVDASDLACDLDDDWAIWLTVRRAVILGRLFGLAAIIPILDDGLPPSEPLDLTRPYRVLNLIVADKRELTPYSWQGNVTKRGFGEPDIWQYSPRAASSNAIAMQIHNSRLLKFGGKDVPRDVLLMNNGADDSVLRTALDAIQHKATFDDSRAVLVNDFKVDVITSPDIDHIATSDEQLEYIDKRMSLLARGKSLLNMIVLDGKETYAKSSTSVAGLADLDDRTSNQLAAALRMPQTRLSGEAPGGLNTDGESQQKNWNDVATAWQRLELRPQLVQLYRIFFGARNGPTQGITPAKFYIEFEPLDEPTEQQKANARKTVAETDAIYLDRGVISPEHVAKGRFSEGAWTVDLPPSEAFADLPDDADVDAIQPDAGVAPSAESSGFNGAQVTAIVAIATSVAAGQISPEQGATIIEAAFGVTPEIAKRIAGTFTGNQVAIAATAPEALGPDNA